MVFFKKQIGGVASLRKQNILLKSRLRELEGRLRDLEGRLRDLDGKKV